MLQVDGEGRLWVATSGVYSEFYVYDGNEWLHLDPPGFTYAYALTDFAVRDQEAWVLTQLTAYRFNGQAWDAYALGVEVAAAPTMLTISEGFVYFGVDHALRFDP